MGRSSIRGAMTLPPRAGPDARERERPPTAADDEAERDRGPPARMLHPIRASDWIPRWESTVGCNARIVESHQSRVEEE
jgi:hypothetical protein